MRCWKEMKMENQEQYRIREKTQMPFIHQKPKLTNGKTAENCPSKNFTGMAFLADIARGMLCKEVFKLIDEGFQRETILGRRKRLKQ